MSALARNRSISAPALSLLTLLAACLGVLLPAPARGGTDARATAHQILDATGVKGGLVVHLGCGDGALTAALCATDSYLVHGLDTDPAHVAAARKHIAARGLYGKVSVERWDATRLPYADDLVNLVVASGGVQVASAEIMRVLAPRGVAYVQKAGTWTKTVKPWPRDIDEWTHYLHDASGNAVAHDTRVGPPKRMQWIGGPVHARSHEIDTSVSALVSARGRIFFILDEGLTGITDERLPQTWAVVARDAFNGTPLWKRPLPDWGWPQWKKKALAGKDWTALRGQRTRSPIEVPRRLVADGDRVYITLGYTAPVSVLDAATGKLLRTCKGTQGTREILCTGDALLLRIVDSASEADRRRGKRTAHVILALDPNTGRELWKKQVAPIVPLCFVADGKRVVFNAGNHLVCLDQATGKQRWRSPLQFGKAKGRRRRGGRTLVLRDGVALLLEPTRLHAIDANTGALLWTAPGGRGPGVANPPDLFVAGGRVWHAGHKQGRNVKTGKVEKTLEIQKLITQGHHFRCYRSKATDRYLLWPKRGVEFLDTQGTNHMRHDWLRAPCKHGVVPANGLLYVPSSQCFCYPGVRLDGFHALAPAPAKPATGKPTAPRLERGPAFAAIPNPQSATANAHEWPTYRQNARRTGSSPTKVAAAVKPKWQAKLGGRLSQPVVAGGSVYVAQVDAHRVVCLSAQDGMQRWSYTTGGRVDSPPTIHQGRVLFGSADGWVYCLRAADGVLAWRFRAAPVERRVGAFGQLESAWPVHGSVLIKDGVAYAAAGRSSYLDGGIFLYGLDPATAKVVHTGRLDSPEPDIANDPGRPFDMDGTFCDVLVTDGTHLFMQQVTLDATLVDRTTPRVTKMGDRRVGRHVFSTAGFLNGAMWNRTFWMYSERWPGFYIANQSPKAGQLLVCDATATYAVKCYTRRNRHSPMFFPGKEGYLLFADANDNEPGLVGADHKPKPIRWLPPVTKSIGHTLDMVAVGKDKGTGFTRSRPPKWATWIPVRVRAMVLAGTTLFIAGPPDTLDPKQPLAAFQGKAGARLWAVSTTDGEKLAELSLDAPPAFDGLVAASGRLYMATTDGRLLCMGAK